MRTPPNVLSLLPELTLEEKASLCLGSDFWHTAPVPRLGIPAITLSDGPHGLRRQPEGGDHVGIGGSLPGTRLPPPARPRPAFPPRPRSDPRSTRDWCAASVRRSGRRRWPSAWTSCSARGSTSSA